MLGDSIYWCSGPCQGFVTKISFKVVVDRTCFACNSGLIIMSLKNEDEKRREKISTCKWLECHRGQNQREMGGEGTGWIPRLDKSTVFKNASVLYKCKSVCTKEFWTTAPTCACHDRPKEAHPWPETLVSALFKHGNTTSLQRKGWSN